MKKIRNNQHIVNEEIYEKNERVKEIGRSNRFEVVDEEENLKGERKK